MIHFFQERLQDALSEVAVSCVEEDIFDDDEDIQQAVLFFNVPCLKSEDDFCLPKFYQLAVYNDPDEDTLTDDELGLLCHPCIQKTISFLAQFDDNTEEVDFLFLDILCLKVCTLSRQSGD